MASTFLTAETPRRTDANELSDEVLVTRFREVGCENSASELVRRHLRRVRAVIFPMVLDHTVADDLAQETFLRAWRGLNGFRAEARFSTWLTRIAWNVVRDEVARRERRPLSLHEADPVEFGNRPDAAVLYRELDGQIQSALSELTPKLRAAIVLTGLQQLSPEDAAELEGCTVATMYWRIHKARRILEQRLSGYLNT